MQRYPQHNQSSNLQAQINSIQQSQAELFKMMESRTRDIIERIHKLQTDQIEIKMFLKTRLGAPDSSRLKDIMKKRLDSEKLYY